MMQESIQKLEAVSSGALVGILSNCAATTNRERLSHVRALIARNPHVFHFEFEDIAQISQGLRMFADAGVALLVINGGDGTIQATLSAILHDKPFAQIPPIAILPGGKTNMIAGDLGCKGTPSSVLQKMLRAMRKGRMARKLVERHVIELDVGDGKPPRVGMFFAGAGIVNSILWVRKRVHSTSLPTRVGHAFAVCALILTALTPRGIKVLGSGQSEISLDRGERMHGRYMIILATTLSRLLFRLRPYGAEGEGGLKISVIEARPGAMRRALFALLTGRFQRGGVDGLHVRRSNRLCLSGSDPVTLDGEIYNPAPGKPMQVRGDRSLIFVKL